MMKRNYIVASAIVLMAALFVSKSASAATLEFDPTSVTCAVNGTCTVDVVVNAGSDEILATDARFTYDSAKLEVVSITDGAYLTIGKKDSSKDGEIYIAGIVDDPARTQTGSGTLATITFKGVANGTATLSYVCSPGETATDSNIAKNDLNATDIIQCSDNGTSTVIVRQGSVPTPLPTSITTTTTTTTTTLPRTGIYDEMIKYAIPGALLLMVGVGAKLLL